jgi:hypothetical protein
MKPPSEGAGGVAQNPTEFKTTVLHPLYKELRMECEKSQNWNQIKPIFDRLTNNVDKFLDKIPTD